MSSPLLAMNIIMRSPIPIPSGLFESRGEPPPVCNIPGVSLPRPIHLDGTTREMFELFLEHIFGRKVTVLQAFYRAL
ncbi:hypothetical protein M405DRAFT_821750 [Rhizopogon salebrosus TDB-379]|nr:hypothetical protein M405DRAFT_821750 [Rhizopogon salebrosus TDB-379]